MKITLPATVWLLTILLFCNRASGQSPEHPDLIVVGGKILTCDGQMQIAEAMAISGNTIIAVSSNAVIQKLAGENTRKVDASGRTITPGLIDSHMHLLGLGETLQQLDLSRASSWSDVVEMVAREAEKKPVGNWIEGHGFHQDKWRSRPEDAVQGYPIHDLLSQAVPNHPVLLTHASGHAIMVNRCAMDLASVDAQTANPAGGEIVKKSSGEPTGLFRENADELIYAALRTTSNQMSALQRLDIVRQRVKLAGDECLKFGVTMVHDAGTSLRDIQLLRTMASEHQLPIRANVMIRDSRRAVADWVRNQRPWVSSDRFLQVRSVKLSIDGALGSHGAWLLEPYYDLESSSGLNTLALSELDEIAEACFEKDWQLCVHAIGDKANRQVLDTYQRVLGGSRADLRWRIEHAQHLHPTDIPRFGELGVIAAMQANHCTSDAVFVPQRLGDRRAAEGAYVWRSLLDSGAMIANGTDAPVEQVDPRGSLFAAVTRQLPNGEKFYPNQCMLRDEALLSYTRWSAMASFSESLVGSLEAGKLADFVIWDTDLLSCDPNELRVAKVLATYLDGNLAFELAR